MKKHLFILVCIALPMVMGCSLSTWGVEYRVSGSGKSFDVTIKSDTGKTSQFDDISSGWTYNFSTEDPNHFLYISAQNQDSSGSVTTEIYVYGDQKKVSTSNGAYAIAICSMSVSE